MAKFPLAGSERAQLAGARCTGAADPGGRLEALVILRRKSQDELRRMAAALAAGQAVPGAPLSRGQFARRFGADAHDIDAVAEFARACGLDVLRSDAAMGSVVLAGTVERFNAAFDVDLQGYAYGHEQYRGHAGPLQLPAQLQDKVVAVAGLDSRPQARPHFRLRPSLQVAPRAAREAYLPSQVAQLYKFPPGAGKGQCIGLIELGGGYGADDAQAYFAAQGMTVPRVTLISVDGSAHAPGGDPGGPDGEVMLDVEIAGTVAPEAHLALYFAANSDAGFIEALGRAVHDDTNRPSVISISWGGPESAWSKQSVDALDRALQAAVVMGVTVCAASGDSGAGDGMQDGANHVDFPASSPHALACGGTSLHGAGGAGEEVAWNDGRQGGASGGGVSGLFELPAWQANLTVHSVGAATALARRGVPDVAGSADPMSGYKVRVDGTDEVVGGTSAVAPLWAALVARINAAAGEPAGYVNAKLYGRPAAFNDITQGNNGYFTAASGWDACTGLGSPDGAKIAAALRGAAAGPQPRKGASPPAAAAAGGRNAKDGAKTAAESSAKDSAKDSTKDGVKSNTEGSSRSKTQGGARGDQPCFDPTAYGNGPDDAVDDASENAAVTHHSVKLDGRAYAYTATAGHLVAVDPSSSRPSARIFYVAFTLDVSHPEQRAVTFFYNGGPGSSSVFVLLGSFAPRRIKTRMPGFTPPAPYAMEDNPDSLLDRSDLVFINPVGTGYSAAIAPRKNRDFWGVDQDAASLKQFIKRYLTANDRWNSPKFLYGESYGTARSAVLSYVLHEDGVDLNGVTIQSSILDYTQAGNPVGVLPTAAADAWYHKKSGVRPRPRNLDAYLRKVCTFAQDRYAAARRRLPKVDSAVVDELCAYTGIDAATLRAWRLNLAASDAQGRSRFLLALLKDQGLALGAYDGRVSAIDTGIAANISPNSGGNDPTMTAVSGVYTAMWHSYLNEDLKFTSNSAFTDLNDQAFQHWDFGHIDPTGAQKGVDAKGRVVLYTAGDLAAAMSLNVDLRVLSVNGYYDFVTPFYQTVCDLRDMPLADAAVRRNLDVRFYPSGHMVYLDGASRTALKAALAQMYDAALADHSAVARIRALQESPRA